MTWSERLERARQRGVCLRCGEPWLGAAQVCEACRGDKRADESDLRESRRSAGLCACGGERDGGKQCRPCVDRVRAAVQRFRARRFACS